MAKKITNKTIAKNMIVSVGAQAISLLTSLIINLIVPKFINEYEYSYWQTYVLYASYVGLLQFGILDGIVLRFSEFDYEELDKEELSGHFWVLSSMFSIFTSIGIIISVSFFSEITRYQIILVSISIITKNLFLFSSYLFQITNRITLYANLVIRQRIAYGLIAIVLILFKQENFVLFCIADIAADTIGFIYSIFHNKEIYHIRKFDFKSNLKSIKVSISAGIFLMIANFSSTFIVGSAKMFVQCFWSDLTFGKVSFGFSITNIFLSFVMALSVVLFPSLKRMNKSELPSMYQKIRIILTSLLLVCMVLYFPGNVILNKWLPKYNESLIYAGILLPIIIYSTKVSLLTNNYLKTYRKEKLMLIINLVSVAIEIVGLSLATFLFHNLIIVLLCTVFITIGRSIVSELVVSKIIGVSFIKYDMVELVLSTVFIICTFKLNNIVGSIVFAMFVCVYLFWNKRLLLGSIKSIRK